MLHLLSTLVAVVAQLGRSKVALVQGYENVARKWGTEGQCHGYIWALI